MGVAVGDGVKVGVDVGVSVGVDVDVGVSVGMATDSSTLGIGAAPARASESVHVAPIAALTGSTPPSIGRTR